MRSSYGTLTNDFRFTGEQSDNETGLVYLRARYYDPSTGRFITRDPFAGTVQNPATQHPYGYVEGNPVNLVDPSGEIAWVPIILVAWAVFEIGSSAVDAYTTANTLTDPCAPVEEKVATVGLSAVGFVAPGGGYGTAAKYSPKVVEALRHIDSYLGPAYRFIQNKAGDIVLVSKDGLRRLQFHMKKTWPHENPHTHVDEFVEGEWKKQRVWPYDVEPK